MTRLKIALAASAVIFVSGLGMTAAPGMPVSDVAKAVPNAVDEVVWVCGRHRCWWRPGRYWARPPAVVVLAPPPYWRPWRRHLRRPWW
jgi:hypothetical protein